jgi:hypothetical protein
MSDDAHSIVVDLIGVHLLTKDLWSHIAGSTAGIKGLLGVLSTGYSKISQSKVA